MTRMSAFRAAAITLMAAALSIGGAQVGWADGGSKITVSGVVTLDGAPIAGVKVCDYIVNECTNTAADGSYTVQVEPDTGSVAYPDPCLAVYPGNDDQRSKFAPVVLNGRSPVCSLSIKGAAGSSVVQDVALTSFAEDTGRVVNAAGKPLAGVTVDGGLSNKTVTDSQGRFRVRILGSGYEGGSLEISAPGYQTAYANRIIGGFSLGTIVLAKESATPRISVTGTVTNAKGAPVARAEVCVVEGACVKTNAKGEYFSLQKSPGDWPASWTFRVFAPNGRSWVESDVRGPWLSNFTREDFRLPAMVSAKPVITGEAKVGAKLVADAGTWTPTPTKLSYRWYANGKKIAGAKSKTLVLKKAQKGKRITVKVTGKKESYPTVTRVSAPTKKVKR